MSVAELLELAIGATVKAAESNRDGDREETAELLGAVETNLVELRKLVERERRAP